MSVDSNFQQSHPQKSFYLSYIGPPTPGKLTEGDVIQCGPMVPSPLLKTVVLTSMIQLFFFLFGRPFFALIVALHFDWHQMRYLRHISPSIQIVKWGKALLPVEEETSLSCDCHKVLT